MYRNTYLEVSLKDINHNYKIYKEETNKHIFTVVKANAYGCGLVEISKFFESLKSSYICVATFDEAMTLREHNIKVPVLVMGHTPSRFLKLAKEHQIAITIPSLSYIYELKDTELTDLTVHIKVNTSMNRIGLENIDEVKEALKILHKQNIEGIFTHYCCNDEETLNKDFSTFKNIVEQSAYDFKYIHASSSYSSLLFKEDFTNAARVGIGLYGGIRTHSLRNVAKLYTEVIAIKEIDTGSTVSYSGIHTASEKELIATLPIGYADGILRWDTGNSVTINHKQYKIVGNICMDQMMIKVDDDVKLYDKVEVFGDYTTITDIADKRKTINYEVLTSISNRVPRIYTK